MFSSGSKFAKIIRMAIDILNVVLGVGVVVLAIMTFLNTTKNSWMFPIIFLGGAVMNLLTGAKSFMTDRKIAGIITLVAGVLLLGVALFTYRAIGG